MLGKEVELDVTNIAHGGVAVARLEGRVVFVSDAIARLGARRFVLAGVACFGASTALLAMVGAPWQLVTVYLLMSFGWSASELINHVSPRRHPVRKPGARNVCSPLARSLGSRRSRSRQNGDDGARPSAISA